MSDADRLLREIAAWCAATGLTESRLGQLVRNHGGFVPLLRKRGTLNPDTAALFRAFMTHFPTADRLPGDVPVRLYSDARAGNFWRPERHRSLMIRYGYPELGEALTSAAPTAAPAPSTGGGKPRIKRDVIRAAALDGRDLGTFVTALIDMGLECWRDDRVLAGEAVA